MNFAEHSRPLSGFNVLEEALIPYHFHGNFSPEFSFGDSHFASSDMGARVSSASSNLTIDGEGYLSSEDIVFKYINEILMEEDMVEKPCMFHDPLALQATEKSFHDVLCEGGHSSMSQSSPVADITDDSCSVISSDFGGNSLSSFTSFGNTADSQWTADTGGTRLSILQSSFPKDFVFQSTASSNSNPSADLQTKFFCSKETAGSSPNERLFANFFTDEAMQFFRKGEEEARRFLPKGNHLLSDIRRSPPNSTLRPKNYATAAAVLNKDTAGYSPPCGAGVKRHGREDDGSQDERSSKQLAPCMDETELSDIFDRVLLCGPAAASSNGSSPIKQNTAESHGSSAESISCNVATTNKGVVDLRTLLFNCAQAVSVSDLSIANEHLQRIRKYASPFGDGSQRLAHYFADALEARMKGTGVETYAALASKRTSVVETLKAYQAYISVCPFQRFGIIFGNHMILGATENAKTIHIIDFGILYGFQWPAFIMCLARRADPPVLRMTAIELPQQGLRPAEGVQQTCLRLEKYCKRFNVPFEYNAIAQKWETIRREDLKIREGEVVIVNSLFRFKNLFDETVTMNSPRDHVLNLVSKIKPRLFVHSVVNGNYNGSLFVTRFREAFYHYSAVFDAFEAKLTRENPMRLAYEKEFFGREIMNVIACEDRMRLERPEGYRQWQTRSARAGLKQIPLDPVVVKKLNSKLKEGYHEDFVLDTDGDWMLQGWKGRILFASSCWVPK